MGRPSKLNPNIQAQICESLKKGIPRKRCAALAGLDESTFSLWYNAGANEPKGPYHDFHAAVNLAEAQLHETVADMLMASCAGNPKLLLAWMGRRFPEEFGRRDNVEVQSAEDQAATEQALRETLLDRLNRYAPIEDAQIVAPALPASTEVTALPDGAASEPSSA